MWTQGIIRTILQRSDAHERLMERKCTAIHSERIWINGYEYGLFMTPNDVTVMAETMHIHGMILEDVISPFLHELALSYGHAENISCMETFVWNVQVVRGILRRPDAHILFLHEYGVNGYEYVLLNDEYFCKELGRLMQNNRIPIHLVIRYSIFQQSHIDNIKALFRINE